MIASSTALSTYWSTIAKTKTFDRAMTVAGGASDKDWPVWQSVCGNDDPSSSAQPGRDHEV